VVSAASRVGPGGMPRTGPIPYNQLPSVTGAPPPAAAPAPPPPPKKKDEVDDLF